MLVEDVAKLSPEARLLYWMRERHNIYLRRKAGQGKPWTDDVILQSYRFCNVRRMDDKVSDWLLWSWYKPNFDHPNMPLAVALARFVNRPDSLGAVGFPREWNREDIKRKLREYRGKGHTVFSGAYMVRGNDGIDKIECVVDYYIKPLESLLSRLDTNTMEGCWSEIVASYGFGSFMAGQVVADLRWAKKGAWSDRMTWAPIGPGSKRGLNKLKGRDKNCPLSQKQFEKELADVIRLAVTSLPEELTSRLEAMDYQNALCEYDKYTRVLEGNGKPKQLYKGV